MTSSRSPGRSGANASTVRATGTGRAKPLRSRCFAITIATASHRHRSRVLFARLCDRRAEERREASGDLAGLPEAAQVRHIGDEIDRAVPAKCRYLDRIGTMDLPVDLERLWETLVRGE